MKDFFKKFFHDSTGSPSMMRLMVFMGFVVVLGVWVFKNIQAPAFVDFAPNARDVLLFLLLGKVGQSATEQPGGIGGMIAAVKSAVLPEKKGGADENTSA